MRRFEFEANVDDPTMVIAERLDAIAHDLERIANELETEPRLPPEGAP